MDGPQASRGVSEGLLMVSLVAWIGLPVVLLAIAFGLGALVQRATGAALPAGLLAPVGAGLALTLTLAGYVVGLRGLLTPLLVVVLAVAGLAIAARSRGGLPRPGLAALAWTATYGLYMAPVVLSGHWTWTGYNFVNDTSIQLLLADWLPDNGRTPAAESFVSTPLDAVSAYMNGGYPVGSHALLGGLHQLVAVRLEALYQPFIATFAGLGTVAFTTLARRLVGAAWALLAGFASMASNLIYQYALQGNMKEIVTAAMLATTAAVAGWSLTALRECEPSGCRRVLIGSAMVLAIPVAAVVNALSTAGGPYVGLVVLFWLALLLAQRLVPDVRAVATALIAGAAVLVASLLVTVSTLITFGEVTTTTYATPETSNDLGHLAGPLDVRQTAGVWLNGDYRVPPVGLNATLTDIGVWLAHALALAALIFVLRRRSFDLLLFSLPVILIMLLVTPRVSPYADAKTFMLMAPGISLLAAVGAGLLARAWAPLGWALGGVLLLGVLGSDALAYHAVQLAPTERMDSMRDLNRRYAGQGLILFNEPEEFAKNFLDDTRLNVGAEAVTPKQTQLRVPQAFAYLWFDLDDQNLQYVEEHPLVMFRRSPSASRPPADYRLDYTNAHYEVWRRMPRPRILEHLPLQGLDQAAAEPPCEEVAALAARARPGEVLVAAAAPTVATLDTLNAERSRGWRPHPYRAGRVSTDTPGQASAQVAVPASGTYRAWIAGTFGREVGAYVDDRLIGAAKGVNTVGQWHDIGTVEVPAGDHELRLRRGGGDLAPGDGYSGELGPLVLERVQPRPLMRVRPGAAERRLCGRAWDWIERVEP